MKKILMIKDGSLPDIRVEREVEALSKEGYQIYLIYSEKAKGKINPIFKETFLVPMNIKARIYFSKEVMKVATQYKVISKKIQPDIIHAHDIMAANIARFIITDKTKFVYDDHEVWEIYTKRIYKKAKGFKKKLMQLYVYLRTKKIIEKILKKIDLLIVINEHWINYYSNKGINKNKIVQVENFASEKLIDEIKKNKGIVDDFFIKDNRKKIIHSYKAKKLSLDIERSILNIAQATAELDDWVLIVFGKIDEKYEEMGVVFFPQTTRLKYLVNCSYCDLALNILQIDDERLNYSSSNRLYEFVSLGLKVISSKVQTLMDKFQDKMIWVNQDTPKEEIKQILRNIDNYPSKEEIQKYSKKFTWEIEMGRLMRKYNDL
ncbi:MAG: glycosyltransferase family 4 protein [Asgard group archaeon]|nr:glycosyltransferase family 4 protein [Asgard group archaeon]